MTAGEDEVSDKKNSEIDRISELPDSLIHHIFSLMCSTRDVARTQLLSKNWKRVFESYQTFDFDQIWFWHLPRARRRDLERRRKEESERFKEHVEKSLATRLDRLDCADKFRLRAPEFHDPQRVAGWIRAAIAKNVKELEVNLGYVWEGEFPMDLTQSSSLTSLKIKGDLLHSLAALKMRNLREILIESVWPFNEKSMKKLEENCPLLEDFKLCHCTLSNLHISSLHKLKTLEVRACFKLQHIKIEAPNLETFRLTNDRPPSCRVDLRCSKNLKNLSFTNNYMDESALEDCISVLTLLEKLELHSCTGIKEPKICSLTLRSLALVHCPHLEQVEVDAPNLHSFRYTGDVMPFPSVNAPRLSEASFSFHSFYRISHEDFFWNLDGSNGFKLLVYTKRNMKIFEDPREEDDPFQTSDDCEVELTKSSSQVVERFEDWLSNSRAKSLVVVSSSSGELLKSINEVIIEREEHCSRRYFKGVKVSTLENSEKTFHVFRWRYRKKKSELS